MNSKLVLKYFAFFLLLSFISVSFLQYHKASLIDEQKEAVQEQNKNMLKMLKKDAKEISELFYFSYVDNNEFLNQVLISNLSKEKKFAQIKNNYERNLFFFKKYQIKELNFYTLDAKPIYKSSFDSYNEDLNVEHKELIKKVSKEFDGRLEFSVNDTIASLSYLRPIFDKNLKPIAIFEISMNLQKITHELFIEKGQQIDFLFKKETIKDKMNSSFANNYILHYINSDYLYRNSFYSNRYLGRKIPQEFHPNIKAKMNTQQEFSVDYVLDKKYYIASFLPINSFSYVILKIECEKYETILKRYYTYTIVALLLSFVLVSFLYFINIILNKYRVSKSELDSIRKSFDKYVIVVETDLRGVITYVSQAFCDVNNYKKEEIVGKAMNIVRHPDISSKFYENMWSKLKNNEIWEGEIKNIDKNGNSYWVRGNIVPIFDLNNKKIGYRSIRVNISDEKQLLKVNSLLKRDLFLKLNEIKTRDKMNMDQSKIVLMGQILDAFSNEWKKPISILSSKILAFENRSNSNNLDDEYLRNLPNELNDELKSLSMHLNEFKTLFSHNNSSEDKYNVYQSIKTAISSVSKREVKIKLHGDESLETYGVFYDLRKIILGIVYNSIEEFKKKGIKEPKIDITVSKTNQDLLIKCKDNAGGIPQEFLDNIFEAGFSTKDNSSTRGLPLHIAKLIVKKLDGDIWVENEEDGCCFYIKLITKDRRESRR